MLSKFRNRFLLEIVVFAAGATVMIYEIIGSRILAPYIGTSTYVWTSLIGVILGGLSLGYWLGGRLADRQPDSKILAGILFAASVLVTCTMLLQEFVLLGLSTVSIRLELKAVIAALVLFAPASVVFGMVSPYAVRLRMMTVEDAGKTVGRIYAFSTIGSIFGTFLAGFFLLPFVGSIRTLYLIAAVLFLLSLLVAPFRLTKKKLIALILFPLAVGANEFARHTLARNFNLHDFDTQYNRVRVWDGKQPDTGRTVRVLSFDPFSTQSSMFLDGDEMSSAYLKFYHLLRHFKPDFRNTLIIGGAGYSFPKEYQRRYPGKRIDVVEIDPQLTEIAKDFFRLRENENLRIFHADGRSFLNQNKQKYDAILVDAYGSTYSAPFQLATIESVRKMNDSLAEDGVLIMNLISAVKGEKSLFFQAEYKICVEVFPQVFLFRLDRNSNENPVQNLILVASKSEKISFETGDEEIAFLLKNRYENPLDLTVPVLTDDLAPVEYYNSLAQESANLNADRVKNKLNSVLRNIFSKAEN